MINYIEKGYSMHDWLQSQSVSLVQKDGVWTANVPDEQVNALIESYNPWPAEKVAKLAEVNAWFESAVAQLTDGTTQAERDSWAVQVNEAYEIRPVAMLAAMAAARGIPVEELIRRVKAKSEAFATYYGAIQGRRDALEDQIKAFPNAGEYHRLPELWAIKCTD